MACMAGLAKLWMALSAQVLQKKKEKHSHTEGSFMKAMGCSLGAATAFTEPAAGLAAVPADALAASARSSSASRLSTMMTSTVSAHMAPQKQAVRQEPVAVVMPAMNSGASAQPILPDRPWTENPWPMRWGETRLLRIVKSTGWKGALPRPAKKEAASSMA